MVRPCGGLGLACMNKKRLCLSCNFSFLAVLVPACLAARKWATDALKLRVPGSHGSNGTAADAPTAAQLFSLSAEAAAATPAPSPHSINDRLSQHTQHCVICQKALKQLQLS